MDVDTVLQARLDLAAIFRWSARLGLSEGNLPTTRNWLQGTWALSGAFLTGKNLSTPIDPAEIGPPICQ